MISFARYSACPREDRVDGNLIAFGKSGRQAMRSRTMDSLRLRYVAMVAISHKSISIGSAGRSCFASSAASRVIRSLSLCIALPPTLIGLFISLSLAVVELGGPVQFGHSNFGWLGVEGIRVLQEGSAVRSHRLNAVTYESSAIRSRNGR